MTLVFPEVDRLALPILHLGEDDPRVAFTFHALLRIHPQLLLGETRRVLRLVGSGVVARVRDLLLYRGGTEATALLQRWSGRSFFWRHRCERSEALWRGKAGW